jgi:uncharacterized protein YbjQ (UPF0145 family)
LIQSPHEFGFVYFRSASWSHATDNVGTKQQTAVSFRKKEQRHQFGDVSQMRVTTLETLAGRSVEETLGVVRGSAIWTRRISKHSTAGHRALEHMTMDEVANGLAEVREKAEAAMLVNAKKTGADGIIGMRFELVELGNDMYQAISYGTAVISEALPQATPAFAGNLALASHDPDAVVVPFQPRRSASFGMRVH